MIRTGYITRIIVLTMTLLSCHNSNIENIIYDDTHHHFVEVVHLHEDGNTDHTHSTSLLVETLLTRPTPEPKAENPFEVIILETEKILKMEGGEALAKIAAKQTSPERKVQEIIKMPNSRAKRLMLEAYAKHNDRLIEMLRITESITQTKTSKKTVEGTAIPTTQ